MSVIVCAYTLERWEAIRSAIASLQQQTRPVDQIVLVADHNEELLERAVQAFPDVTCLPSKGPRGLSGARNTGVEAATGQVVAFLDDDASAAPDWVARMVEAYGDDEVLGVGGWVTPDWKAPRPLWFPDEFLWVVGCSYEGLPRSRAEVRNPIGAGMSFRRSVFDTSGGFDATMGRLGKDAAGCEETEFAIRARRTNGGRILLEPRALCMHAVTPDRTTRRYFRQRCRAEGRSKAMVSRLVGAESALDTERRYVSRTLPRGVLHALRDAVLGDLSGLSRAWAIAEGALLTAAGYAVSSATLRLRSRHAGP